LGTLALNIAAAATGYLENTTVDATGATLKFTATTYGAGTLALTSSVDNASNQFTTTAAVVGSAGSAAVPASPAVAQVDRLTINGSFDAGDEVKVTIDARAFTYTVSDADAKSDNPSEAIAKGIALSLLEASPAPGVTVIRTGSNLSFTGNANGTPFTASTSITREGVTITPPAVGGKPAGSLNMIEDTTILTRDEANTAIESVDAAMSVINLSRADMGAVMNRLTYAGENLINVAQNTTESRSRILDTDFAKASSELARTQIISQAATSVLAQANQSQQSVLKLLQG
jgi:flagellin